MSFFSIIMPTYNRAHLISRGIESVINQSFQNWELIVVDDGSLDNTKEVVESFFDKRIRYIYQENSERSVARNNGISHAQGEWICFLDSDDYFLNHHLETFKKHISDKNLAPSFLVSGSFEEQENQLIKKSTFDSYSGIHPARFILEKTIITPISVCIHNKCLIENKFPEIYKKAFWEDTHLWIRLALLYPFIQIDEYTCVLSEHPGRSVNKMISISRVEDHINMIKHLFTNFETQLSPILIKKDAILYIDRKYRMFLYLARTNRQLKTSLIIYWKSIIYRPSWYFLSEFPKIFLNKMNIGIYDR
jgi:glycosyltransferase involved in cell wall biosynthesis